MIPALNTVGIEGEEKEAIGKDCQRLCATCDAFFYKRREILVVGGVSVAYGRSPLLTRFASKVTVIHRRNELLHHRDNILNRLRQ